MLDPAERLSCIEAIPNCTIVNINGHSSCPLSAPLNDDVLSPQLLAWHLYPCCSCSLFAVHASSGMTPLHWAAHGGHLETVQVLLQAGANASIGSEDSQGTTPLAWAAYAGHRHIIQLMLDQQGWAAGVGITESNLVSAARAAAMQGQMSVFAVLTAEIGLRHPAALPSLLVGPLAPEPASAFIAMTSLCAEQRQRELQHQEESQRQQEQLVHEREELAAVKAGTQHLIIQAAGVAKKAMQLAGSDVQ